MTDTRTDVTPALTAQHWKQLRALWVIPADDPEGVDFAADVPGLEALDSTDPYALAAVALFALPDDHPGKLTREMVEMLEHAVSVWVGQTRLRDDAARSEYAIMTGALAALRALLPPAT